MYIKNYWYSIFKNGKYSLYNSNQKLIAEDLNYCYVFNNGWYKLKKNNKYSLFNSNHEFIADNFDYCHVYLNKKK